MSEAGPLPWGSCVVCTSPSHVCRPNKRSKDYVPGLYQVRCYRHRKGWVRVYPRIESIYP